MNNNDLLDSWCREGNDFSEFAKVLTDLDRHTGVMLYNTRDIGLYSLVPEACTEDFYALSYVDSETKPSPYHLKQTSTLIQTMSEKLRKELLDDSRLIMRLDKHAYLTSHYLCRDFAARADIGGDAIYSPSKERDAYVMSRYAQVERDVFIVYRFANVEPERTLKKVFSMPSSSYSYIRQTFLLDIFAELEKAFGYGVCEFWSIDHNITRIWLSFPEKAEDISKVYGLPDTLIPGVLMETSDTGDCALRVVAAWKKKSSGSRSTIGVFEREHRGTFSESQAMERVKNELATTYTKLPERLCELLTIDIPEPDAAIEETFRLLGVEKGVGKKQARIILEGLINRIPAGEKMTGYDLAMLFIDIPSLVVKNDRIKEFFEKAAGKVPFLDFDKIMSATSKVLLRTSAS